MATKHVTLRNGSQEALALVGTISMAFTELWKNNTAAAYQLVLACRTPEYRLSDNDAYRAWHNKSLVQGRSTNGTVWIYDSVRNVVLSSVKGEGENMRLVPPVAAGK